MKYLRGGSIILDRRPTKNEWSLLREADRLLDDRQYEKALTKYYAGKKLRPQNPMFTIGIKRCHDAISADIDMGISAIQQRKSEGFLSPLRAPKTAPVEEVKSDVEHMARLRETKEFLNTLAEESGVLLGKNNTGIKKIVSKEENYLQNRTLFWRQLYHLQNASERLKQIAPTHTNADYLYKLMSNVSTGLLPQQKA
ncbi:hypothetical protein CAPTEDRAFT_212684 [Capitella teleta]|uniref:Uncharacterized protein n=1 Tax=Capitella teleta TaxID=283909 RepID=R7TYV4_CAPTE|nr:hypothetical protein CAPTEDRAFT_212684 [Capitella teleta]|eukprot:ELT98914.1 hypothetical protein CAPTEDRAFT_212684 [Capitella teleta]